MGVAYEAPNPRSLEIVASLLPDGVAQSLMRTCETMVLVAQALFVSGPQDGAPEPVGRPDIRVAHAVHAAQGVDSDLG